MSSANSESFIFLFQACFLLFLYLTSCKPRADHTVGLQELFEESFSGCFLLLCGYIPPRNSPSPGAEERGKHTPLVHHIPSPLTLSWQFSCRRLSSFPSIISSFLLPPPVPHPHHSCSSELRAAQLCLLRVPSPTSIFTGPKATSFPSQQHPSGSLHDGEGGGWRTEIGNN